MTRRLRVLTLILICSILTMLFGSAVAHIACQCGNPADQCICFVQLGDKGLAVRKTIEVLQSRGYLDKVKKKSEFTIEVQMAIKRFQIDSGLEDTGWLDDETLNMLLGGKPKQNEMIPSDGICYVPTDGGQKYHLSPFCSGMQYPRLISIENAKRLGIDACGKKTCARTTTAISSAGFDTRTLSEDYYLASAEPAHSNALAYIGNKNSHVFHLAGCQSASSMNEKNKVFFGTRDEAVNKGYKPCSKCKP